jgi:hypothetical protein
MGREQRIKKKKEIQKKKTNRRKPADKKHSSEKKKDVGFSFASSFFSSLRENEDEFDGEEEIANASSLHRLVFNIIIVFIVGGKEKKFAEGKTRVKKARGGGARTIDKGNRKKTGRERREEKAVRARVGRRAATTAAAAAAAAADSTECFFFLFFGNDESGGGR